MIYLIDTIIFLFLTIIWSRSDVFNIILRITFALAMFINGVAAVKWMLSVGWLDWIK